MGLGGHVAVFWDCVNSPLPAASRGSFIADNIRAIACQFGTVTAFKAYADVSDLICKNVSSLRSELQMSGISLVDIPGNGTKDAAIPILIADMSVYALDSTVPVTVVVISNKCDLSYPLSILRLRGHKIVVVAPKECSISIKYAANVCFEWERDIVARNQQPLILTRNTPCRAPKQARELKDAYQVLAASDSPMMHFIDRDPGSQESRTKTKQTVTIMSDYKSSRTDNLAEAQTGDATMFLDDLRQSVFPWVLYHRETSDSNLGVPPLPALTVEHPDVPTTNLDDISTVPDSPNTPQSSWEIPLPTSPVSVISDVISQARSLASRTSSTSSVKDSSDDTFPGPEVDTSEEYPPSILSDRGSEQTHKTTLDIPSPMELGDLRPVTSLEVTSTMASVSLTAPLDNVPNGATDVETTASTLTLSQPSTVSTVTAVFQPSSPSVKVVTAQSPHAPSPTITPVPLKPLLSPSATTIQVTTSPVLPDKFRAIARDLEIARRKGNGFRALTSVQSGIWGDPTVRKAAGTENFDLYVQMAVQAGVVQVIAKQYLALQRAWHNKVS